MAYAASFLARFASQPTPDQVKATMRTLLHCAGTKEDGIRIGSMSDKIKLVAYADAAFSKDEESHAQLGFCLFLSEDAGTVYWKSTKDKSVSMPSTQAEIHALVECIKVVLWYRELL